VRVPTGRSVRIPTGDPCGLGRAGPCGHRREDPCRHRRAGPCGFRRGIRAAARWTGGCAARRAGAAHAHYAGAVGSRSLDGKWFAYASRASGQPDVFVRPVAATRGKFGTAESALGGTVRTLRQSLSAAPAGLTSSRSAASRARTPLRLGLALAAARRLQRPVSLRGVQRKFVARDAWRQHTDVEPGSGLRGHQAFAAACSSRLGPCYTLRHIAYLAGQSRSPNRSLPLSTRSACRRAPNDCSSSHGAESRPIRSPSILIGSVRLL
jgi:hypothetical protein